ncbi:unnamed protein product [Orchesella dallaii]|uniref:Uncharacterized protein n=1 Tax=Orchesella dallaii TaxID=48710 RepID=A0ABP1QCP4_9HEXA
MANPKRLVENDLLDVAVEDDVWVEGRSSFCSVGGFAVLEDGVGLAAREEVDGRCVEEVPPTTTLSLSLDVTLETLERKTMELAEAAGGGKLSRPAGEARLGVLELWGLVLNSSWGRIRLPVAPPSEDDPLAMGATTIGSGTSSIFEKNH